MGTRKRVAKFQYTNDRETRTFEIPIGISVDFRFFYRSSDLPKDLQERISSLYISDRGRYFDSYSEVRTEIENAIEEYEASFVEETRRKIIRYKMSASKSDSSSRESVISLRFAVVWEYMSGKDKRYQVERRIRGRIEYEEARWRDSDWDDDEAGVQEMEWTEQRENWFSGLAARIDALGDDLRRGIGKQPTVLTRKIEQHHQLLPGVQDEKKESE